MIKLTPSAETYLENVARDCGVSALRLSLKNSGCAGYAYDLNPVQDPQSGDLVFEQGRVRIYIDKFASIFLLGTEINFEETPLKAGLSFTNPNVQASCGCGASVVFS